MRCASPFASRTRRSLPSSEMRVARSPAAAMAEALLALGANVGDVRATLERAVEMLCDGDLVRMRARSSDYQTPPWGVEQQPEFVNLCVAVDTELSPQALLERAQQIERTLGRDRAHELRWGPRPIDIDLLAY